MLFSRRTGNQKILLGGKLRKIHEDRSKAARIPGIWRGALLYPIKKYKIDYINIKSIPQSIGNLSELISLNLSDNNLRQIPRSIAGLDKLRILNLSHNNLKTLPDISSMKRLRDLNLSHNKFNEIPQSVEEVKNTLNLNIDSNPVH